MGKLTAFLMATVFACGALDAAAQSNPAPASWQGPRNAGNGVCYQNTGQGVTLQDASAGQCTFSAGLRATSASLGASIFTTPVFLSNMNIGGTAHAGTLYYNQINVGTDSADASGAAGGGAVHLYVGENISAGAVGGRTGLTIFQQQTGVTTLAPQQYYTALATRSSVAFSAGGAAGAGNARGNIFGTNPLAIIKNGAGLYWNSIVGTEVDLSVETGTGVLYKEGMKVVIGSTDAVHGISADYGYGLAASPSGSPVGLTFGFAFGSPEGWWPISSTGTVIGTYTGTITGGPSMAAAHGIDFSAVTFSSDAFKSTGFLVDGGGNVTGASYKAGAAAGVSCSGTPTASFASAGGIVTHC